MATVETICKFNQSGFCKFLSHCRKQHVMEICPTNQCNNKTCLLRHPKICKYFSNSGSCKFDEHCTYLHIKNTLDGEIGELETKIKEMENKIHEIEILQLRLDQQENQLKLLDADCKKLSEQKDENQQIPSENETKVENLVEKIEELSLNFNILLGSVDDLERKSKFLEHHLQILTEQSQSFKCNLCGKIFQTEQTINEHTRRHHRTPKT